MKIIISLAALLLTACSSIPIPDQHGTPTADSYRIYTAGGDFAGHIDKTNRIYDRNGNFIGMIRK